MIAITPIEAKKIGQAGNLAIKLVKPMSLRPIILV
jgi:hypothetical protein